VEGVTPVHTAVAAVLPLLLLSSNCSTYVLCSLFASAKHHHTPVPMTPVNTSSGSTSLHEYQPAAAEEQYVDKQRLRPACRPEAASKIN
jgi:hypothetical protein